MHHLKTIRERLGITQQAMADGLGCTQGNVGHYERGQTLPPVMAKKLIDFCASRGLTITFDHVYGDAPIGPADGGEPCSSRLSPSLQLSYEGTQTPVPLCVST